MKTPHTPHTILSLLSVTLLTFSAASAQVTPPDLGSAVKNPASKQQFQELVSKLSVPEKLQLKAATKKVRNDPQMVAARQSVKDAQTKEAKHEAKAALCTLRHDLLLKADPALSGPAFKPIMDHIDAAPIGKAAAPTK